MTQNGTCGNRQEGHAAGAGPDFLLIGAQKAGSSTLHDYLSQHPQLFMSPRKELHYFDDGWQTKRFCDYLAAFSGATDGRLVAESTPAYLSYPGCAEKIRACLGDIPLLVITRDPVQRMYSQYWHAVKYGYETLDFAKALDAEETRRAGMGMAFFRHFDYLSRSAYETHLAKYRALFSSVHVCCLEDLSVDPLSVVNGICAVLGVAPLDQLAPRAASNAAQMPRFPLINTALNAAEDRFGASRLTRTLRRRNFRPFKYPPLSKADRSHAISRLNGVCPDTVSSHGLR